MHEYEFDVAPSFAGEDRDHVLPVVRRLEELGVKVFYDEDRVAELWGVNLVDHLPEVYGKKVRYVLLFASKHYVEKKWTRVERQAAQARALDKAEEYLLPIRIDDTEVPGLPPTIAYLDLQKHGTDVIAAAVVKKLGRHSPAQPELITKAPRTADEVKSLLAARPPAWPYLLFAGILFQGVNALEPKFRDHVSGYAPRNGAVLDVLSLDPFRHRHAMLAEITDSAERILSPEKRLRTFGEPGDTNNLNPDEVIHTAQRLVELYGELLDWARDVRGTTYLYDEVRRVASLQARYADGPVTAIRKLAADFLMLADTLVERVSAGENVTYEFMLSFTIDPNLSLALDDAIEQVKRSR
ncbi:toll/interleukin-1 receptor domain-containing protein [Lentzea sp. NPDC059081]|uniref:toll/interleukin-1 receptor domain-containing protein n=1 Tax=Lentzea sp. NPDC059081 TaxID=3346719 RepID=UPI0036ABDBF1